MSSQTRYFYEFGPFRIDTVNRLLSRNGAPVPLKAKAVETLLLLVQRNGEVVEKDDLMSRLWPDSFVEEANLTQNIYMLRKALGDGGYIETVPRRGYRFSADVKAWNDPLVDLILIQEKTRTSLSFEEVTEEGAPALEHDAQTTPAAARAEALPSQKIDSPVRPVYRQRLSLMLILSAAVIVVAAVVFWPRHPRTPFENLKLTRFTTTGKAEKAAISPDGKYLAHVSRDAGQQSVWLRQIVTGKDLQIIPPAPLEFYGLTFSHDGNYIYYVSQEMNRLGILFQVPSLGGASTRISEDVDSPVTVSPDDKRLAFIRLSPAERSMIIANVDGSGERKLASSTSTAEMKIEPSFLIPPAWSPDGKIIACPVGLTAAGDEDQTIWGFQAETGKGQALTTQRWQTIGRMEWLADGSGILATAADKGANFAQQVWYVPYPTGAVRRITNDLNDYRDLSVTADGQTVIAVQYERKANIWVAPAANPGQAKQVTFTNYDALDGLAWMPDGKLVYTQQADGEQNLWLTDPGGSTPVQLTSHAGFNLHPAASPDGRYIVFVSTRSGQLHLWRIDANGKHPLELSHGNMDDEPDFALDGQSVLFSSYVPGSGTNIFRVPIDGGQPVRLTEKISANPMVSPEGKRLALIYRAAPAAINKMAIMPLAGGEPVLLCDLPAHYGRFHWTPDGNSLAIAVKQQGSGNIWAQPIAGGAPKQLTNWRAAPILSFDWSRDGKWLAYADGTLTSDVVLIKVVGR